MSDSSGRSKVARRIRTRAMVFLSISLVAGAAAVFLVKGYMDRARAAASRPAVQTVAVVVAAADLSIATSLQVEHLTVVQFPAGHVPAGSFADPAEVIDFSLNQSVFANEPIIEERLISPEHGRGLSVLLTPGMRAMAIKVDQVVGVAGFVHPGDFVDVLVTASHDEETKEAMGRDNVPRLSKTVLQNMKVLAVGQHLTTDSRRPVAVPVVTLEVDVRQSERLALATQYGRIQLTMRSRLDQEPVETEGITPFALLTPEESPELLEAQFRPRSKAPVVRRSPRSKRPRSAASAAVPAKAAAETPIVEILRGDKREQQKLRPSADSK